MPFGNNMTLLIAIECVPICRVDILFFRDAVHWEGTVAYLGHGEKTNYSANPPGRNTNPPGRNSQSARAE